ncbi:MAG: DUF4430 domain-containing protein [Candidatus Kerfeldbacteria bacterium]|nr:DUF4430 domain-containing protein [Candidatus Kerfeldbacteria bacterium]
MQPRLHHYISWAALGSIIMASAIVWLWRPQLQPYQPPELIVPTTVAVDQDTVPVVTSSVVTTPPVSSIAKADGTTTIEPTKPIADGITTAVQLIIIGPGVNFNEIITVTDAITVHRLMKQASTQFSFTYHTKTFSDLGVFVDGLAGVQSNDLPGRYWIYSVNGKKATVGVDQKTVTAGDTIQWKYEAEY